MARGCTVRSTVFRHYSKAAAIVGVIMLKRNARGLRTLLHDERGTEVLEWGLVCGLIVIGTIAAIMLIGPKVKSLWEGANNAIPAP